MIVFAARPIVDVPYSSQYFLSSPVGVVIFNYNSARGLGAYLTSSTPAASNLTTSDGTSHRNTVNTSKIPPPFALANWTLTAEHWDPPANLSDIETIAVKHNTTHSLLGTQVSTWPKIKGLQNTSGVEYYTTAFTWPPYQASVGLTKFSANVQFTSPALQSLHLAIKNVTYPKLMDYFNPSAEPTP